MPVPGHECVEVELAAAPCELVENVGEPGFRVDAVEPRGLKGGVDDSGAFAALVGTEEKEVLAGNRLPRYDVPRDMPELVLPRRLGGKRHARDGD